MRATSKQMTLGKIQRPIVFRYRPPAHQHLYDPDSEINGKVRCLTCGAVVELDPLILEDVREIKATIAETEQKAKAWRDRAWYASWWGK
jgi:hypothetical protein